MNDVETRKNKHVRNIRGTRQIKSRPAYIMEKRKRFADEIAVIAIPITEDDHRIMKTYFDNEEEIMVRLCQDLVVNKKAVKIFGGTDEIEPEVADLVGVESMWEYSFADVNNLIINTVNRQPQITQYFDSLAMLKVALAMIGNPSYAVVFEMRLDRYLESPFYINNVKF